jgi:hypothetical protein
MFESDWMTPSLSEVVYSAVGPFSFEAVKIAVIEKSE